MKLAPTHRALVAWLLYSCVLFSSFACAIGHGQNSGLQLSGLAQRLCSTSSDAGSQTPSLPSPMASFDCPVCANHGLLPTALSGWRLDVPAWRPSPLARPLNPIVPLSASVWPPASPRAPPVLQRCV